MQEILDNIDAGVKAGLEKARKANTVEPLVGFDIGDACEMPDGKIGLVTGYHSDDRHVWVTPWDETKEIKFDWEDIVTHWKKANAPAEARCKASPPAGCSARALAKQFHDTYERLAPSFGYETRPETREFNPESPNGRLMVAVCKEIIEQNAAGQTPAAQKGE